MPCSWHRRFPAQVTHPIFMACRGTRPCPMYPPRRLRRPIGSSQGCTPYQESYMLKKTGWVSAALALTALSTLASVSLGAGSAQAAVVYCKTAGVPQGCVVRPTVPVAVVAAPRVRVATVGVARVGVGRVGVGARGVGYRPGTPWHRG